MDNRVLKLIVLIENILSIYRNYDSLSVPKKIMVSLRMTLEILLILTITAVYVVWSFKYNYPDKYSLTYLGSNITFSVIVILLPAYKSIKSNKLIDYLEKTHTYFSGDDVYIRNIIRKYKIIKIIAILYGIFSWCIWLYVAINIKKPNKAIFVLMFVVYFICEIRYVVEYVVLYGILAVLSEQVKSIARSIGKDTKTVIRRQDYETQIEIIQDTANFSKWTQLYTTLKDCSNLINNVFGVQITIILTMATINNIILCYKSIANYYLLTHESVVYTTYRQTMFIIALFLLSRGAHTTQDSVEELRQCLASLLIHSTADHKVYKIIRDFLRLITNQPLKTQAFGSITINMSLVPKFIMFFTSYTVIALQFNNVM